MRIDPLEKRRAAGGALALALACLALAGCGDEPAAARGGGGPREISVVSAGVTARPVTRTIEGVADVLAAEAVTITAEAPGRVTAILFEPGARVRRGQVLVRLDAEQEAADVATRRAEAAELEARLGRLRRLAAEGAIARGRVEDLEAQLGAARARTASSRTLLDETTIRAPFAGTIGLREVSPGALVQPGTELVTLDNIDTVKLRFTVPENAIGRLRLGANVIARSSAHPGREFTGRLRAIDSRLDPAQRSLAVEARAANPGGLLKPGMLAEVTVATETAAGLTVPPLAVQVRGNTQFVYAIEGGCARRVEVAIGQREPEWLEITRGLREGQRVAVEGLQSLTDGAAVGERRVGQRPPGGERGRGGGEEDPAAAKAKAEEIAARCKPAGGRPAVAR